MLDELAAAIGGLSRRTIDNYRNGSTLPPDATRIADAFFGDDSRHAAKRNAFMIAFAEATGTEPPPWAFAVSNIPVRMPAHFLGRYEALAAIHTALGRFEARVAITALHGLRGVGKTTLAAAYAERHRSDYRATWWVRAQTDPTMRADLAALGVRLGWVDAGEKEDPALATVMERLRHEGDGILLIYDNAFDARRLVPYLPHGGATQVLVTSNAHDWRGLAEPVEVGLWPKAIGADYLIARTSREAERDAAEALSMALDGLPLAHEQAAAYCERLGIAFAEYSQRLAAKPMKMLDDQRHAPAQYYDGRTVAKTFGLAIEAASKEHPAAEPLIVHLALLPPEPIPLFVLKEGRVAFGEPLAGLLSDDGLDEAIAALRGFALVGLETITDEREPGITTDTVRLHRLVREVAGVRLTAEGRERAQRALIASLCAVFPDDVFKEPGTWPRARRLDALAFALVSGDIRVPEGAEAQAAQLLNGVGGYWHQALGTYSQARPLFERALAIYEATFGPDHLTTVISLNNLGIVVRAQGDLAGARLLYERALPICEKSLGPEHYYTAVSLNNFASVLRAQGDLAGARPSFERALTIYEKALGTEHPETAACLNNLAGVLQDQGDLVGARPFYERALAIHEKAHGASHPFTATSLANLAGLFRAQGDLIASQQLYERALAIYEKALGAEHPHTATILGNLAGVLQGQGDLVGARPFYERALVICEKVLGSEHPHTAGSLNNFASVLRAQGDLAGARKLYERTLAICDKTFDPEHPSTMTTLSNLADVLEAQGDFAAALPFYERALAISEKALGAEHPYTAGSLNNLARVLRALGDLGGARKLYERTLAVCEKIFGAEHFSTTTTLSNLADVLEDQGDLAAARPLYERALAASEKAFGVEHPETAGAINNLAGILGAQGDLAGARVLLERAQAICNKALGVEHPHTAISLINLANVLQAQGDLAGARVLLQRAADIFDGLGRGEEASALRRRY